MSAIPWRPPQIQTNQNKAPKPLPAESRRRRKKFFSTQPTLTQVPPKAVFSANTTRAPCAAANRAARTPPEPPPNNKQVTSFHVILRSVIYQYCASCNIQYALLSFKDGLSLARSKAVFLLLFFILAFALALNNASTNISGFSLFIAECSGVPP